MPSRPDNGRNAPAASEVLAKACGQANYHDLLHAVAEARQGVANAWADLFGETLEII